jgi:hypothetical protein
MIMKNEELEGTEVFWHLWPCYDMVQDKWVQVGMEVELDGSHSSDPNHIAPGCCQCRQLSCELERFAASVARRSLSGMENRLCCTVDVPRTAVVTSPRLGERWYVPVTITLKSRERERPEDADMTRALAQIKRALLERGFLER